MRSRLTSRISTSRTTSARGLSLALMIRSMTSTTGAVARTVIVFAVLFGITIGCTGICGMRMIGVDDLRQLGRVRVRDVEHPDDELVVLRVLRAADPG